MVILTFISSSKDFKPDTGVKSVFRSKNACVFINLRMNILGLTYVTIPAALFLHPPQVRYARENRIRTLDTTSKVPLG